MSVLLLNMLIAMMACTFQTVWYTSVLQIKFARSINCFSVEVIVVQIRASGSHYRALAFGRPQNDGTRSFYFETTSKPGEIFIALHLGSYQGVFYYKKTRPCLFCSCPATCEVAFFTSTFLRNYFLSQEMMCALSNCYQVQPR